MRIVALDLSLTATGVADNFGGAQSARIPRTIRSGERRGVERLYYLQKAVDEATASADLVVLEGYAFARPNQAHQLGELGGVIRLTLYVRKRRVLELAPSVVKKLASGKGNARKEEVLVEAVKRLHYLGADNNQADALWLLQAALQHYDLPGRVDLPKTHLEALEKVDWPALTAGAAA